MMDATDKFFYFFGVFILAALLGCGILIGCDIFVPTDIYAPCAFRYMTGLLCPGCNGTHSVCALVRGHFVESFLLHPFVFVTSLLFFLFVLWNTIALVYNRILMHFFHKKNNTKLPIWHFHIVFVYLVIGFLFIPWIIRNILIIVH